MRRLCDGICTDITVDEADPLIPDSLLAGNVCCSDDDEHDDSDNSDNDEFFLNNEEFMEMVKKHIFQKRRVKNKLENPHHVSILLALKYFNIPEMCPFEYMHLVCLGISEALAERLALQKYSRYMLKPKNMQIVSHRLWDARKYHPCEFQRKPERIDILTSWKATQKRTFTLYYAPVVLRDVLHCDRL